MIASLTDTLPEPLDEARGRGAWRSGESSIFLISNCTSAADPRENSHELLCAEGHGNLVFRHSTFSFLRRIP